MLVSCSDAFSVEKRSTTSFDGASSQISEKTNASTSSINPLVGIPEDQILEDADKYAIEHDLEQYRALLKKGALVAQDPTGFEAIPSLSEEDRVALRREVSHPHRQPYMMYFLVVLCSLAAAVQGVRFISQLLYFFLIAILLDGRVGDQRRELVFSKAIRHPA